jgi:GT2 family glycosyltransferase
VSEIDRAGGSGMRIGVVVIGRNEGDRLERCLQSVVGLGVPVVYADSGSSDGSPGRAAARGVDTLALDASAPYTAARGRNAGIAHLARGDGDLEAVQVLDGDCELVPGWLEAAAGFLAAHPDVAIACGRRRERHPDASPWNLVTDVEWDTPPGDVDACGGDALIRLDAWRAVGGYDASLIAGEDPEFCYRVRRIGGRIVRLDREMTLHDAALLRASQWWRRTARGGFAYAALVARHRDAPPARQLRQLRSIAIWGALLPLACVGLAWPTAGRHPRRRRPARVAALYATACVLGKFAECQGASLWLWNHALRRRATRLMEYKGPGT